VRRGEPVRRCLACNSCVDGMRAGARLSCIVNPTTGREREFARRPPRGERIAVIGAGPAGLSYAHLVAAGNEVTVFEREAEPGGALRLAAKAPLFQGVDAAEPSLAAYIDSLVSACRHDGVTLRMGSDPSRDPEMLARFDRVVVATGARYRFGLGTLVRALLRAGAGRRQPLRRVLASAVVRDWLYHRARAATGEALRHLAGPGRKVVVLGDARTPGKTADAVTDAFEAALLGRE
jgi:threonine dehydrogenase-like Zn-dependent dehydrogenase